MLPTSCSGSARPGAVRAAPSRCGLSVSGWQTRVRRRVAHRKPPVNSPRPGPGPAPGAGTPTPADRPPVALCHLPAPAVGRPRDHRRPPVLRGPSRRPLSPTRPLPTRTLDQPFQPAGTVTGRLPGETLRPTFGPDDRVGAEYDVWCRVREEPPNAEDDCGAVGWFEPGRASGALRDAARPRHWRAARVRAGDA